MVAEYSKCSAKHRSKNEGVIVWTSAKVELLKSVLIFFGAVLKLHGRTNKILLFEEVKSASKELLISFKVWLILQEYN